MEWEKLFKPKTLERGRNYAKEGKVTKIKQKSNTVSATIEGRETYSVSITYGESIRIAEMSCTCPSYTKTNYCKHCAALLFATSDSTKSDTSPSVSSCVPPSTNSITYAVPKSATTAEKLKDIKRQLISRYSTKEMYHIWEIKQENPEVNWDTIKQWVRKEEEMSLGEWLTHIGVLKQMCKFNFSEDTVELHEIAQKNCCAVAPGGGHSISVENLMKKLGANIVSFDDTNIDFLFVFEPHEITKVPVHANTDAYNLFTKKENGERHFSILGNAFYYKLVKYEESLKRKKQTRAPKKLPLPSVNEFSDLFSLPPRGSYFELKFNIDENPLTIGNYINPNLIYKFHPNYHNIELNKMRNEIKELLELDYYAIFIKSNYNDLSPVDTDVAQKDYLIFKRICDLCKYDAVLKLITYAVPRNNDGSLKKKTVTTIARTSYIHFDPQYKEFGILDFKYFVLVAKTTNTGIELEIRQKNIVRMPEEDICELVDIPETSQELLDKILQIGEIIESKK